ncbi:MAG: hypothetical protein ACR2FM_01695 [Candidatus Saccharimonadales bacterium]
MKQKHPHWLKNSLVRVAKIQLALVVIYVAQIMAYDAAKLITPEAVLQRWYAVAGLTIVSVGVWYLARGKAATLNHYKLLTWLIILTDIAFAVFNVYTQRGMSSRSVALFFIPIIISSILLSRVALFTTAILCVAAYTTTAVAYFVNYFNEGYKIELYGEISFYSSLFLLAAALLWVALKSKRHT